MYVSAAYPEVTPAEIDAFVAEQFCGKVIAVDDDGFPRISILPFVRDGDQIEVHMVQADPTCAALRARGRGSFLLDEPLAFTPHHVVHPRYAGMATLHFRAVLFHVEARVSDDAEAVAAALQRLMAAYEPQASWDPVVNGPTYGHDLRRLAVARLHVVGVEAKFKVAQNRDDAGRNRVVEYLRGRGRPADLLAAERIEAAARSL